MFERFSTALLLATGAIADQRAPICCSVFEGESFTGKYSNLCLSRTIHEESFDVTKLGFSEIGSFECGENTHFSFCDHLNEGDCTSGNGPQTIFDAELGSDINWVTLKYKNETNLNLNSITEKSNALFQKLNLSSGVDCSDLPADASAHWYAGLLYAFTYQEVDEREYLLECSEQRDELDHKLSMAYSKYNDEDYKGGNFFMEDSENDWRRSMD